jgi:DNA repair protein RecO (recombination protein O)
MIKKTEAIVLRTHHYGDADLIVTYLTPTRGIVKAFAKSPRKTKSRFGSSLEPLTHAYIALLGKEQSTMLRIIQSDIIHSFQGIRDNFDDFVYISRLVEILISFIPEGSGGQRLFTFFKNCLNMVATIEESFKQTYYLICLIRFLSFLGYAPSLNGCGRCGKESRLFSPSQGTILCGTCTQPDEKMIVLSPGALSLYKHILTWPYPALKRLRPSLPLLSELFSLIDEHITCLINKKLRTSEFSHTTASHFLHAQ